MKPCRDRITRYCDGLESHFPQGYPGSNPGRGVLVELNRRMAINGPFGL